MNPWRDPSKAPHEGLVFCRFCDCWVQSLMGDPEIAATMQDVTGTPQEIAEEYCRRVTAKAGLRRERVVFTDCERLSPGLLLIGHEIANECAGRPPLKTHD